MNALNRLASRFGLRPHLAGLLVLATTSSGCLTLRSQHEELESEVFRLKAQAVENDKALKDTLLRANEQLADLQDKIGQAEKVLRTSQAGLVVRVENLEGDLGAVRGAGEDATMELDSFKRSVEELRADLDSRINALESKLNSATDIPESKTELLAAANQALNGHDYTRARRLFRTFLSRYPDDENGPEVRFKVGLSLYNEQDYRSALGEFNWIRKNAAKSDVIHDTLYYLGLGLAKTGECKKAITYFEFLASRKSTAPKGHKDKALKQVEQIRKSAAELCTDGESAQPVAGDQK